MIPLKDDNPTANFPLMTIILIAVNILVFFLVQPMEQESRQAFIMQFGFLPARLFFHRGGEYLVPPFSTIFTSMFLHGGIIHLAGNMLYLWIFGNNIEDIMGKVRFLLFYLLCGLSGALLQGVLDTDSTVPMIGASGAISGVLGAYLLRFPRARVTVLIFFFYIMQFIKVPASIVLGFWIVFQVLAGLGSLGGTGGGVAFFAHIGGFAAGLALVSLFAKRRREYYGRWRPFA